MYAQQETLVHLIHLWESPCTRLQKKPQYNLKNKLDTKTMFFDGNAIKLESIKDSFKKNFLYLEPKVSTVFIKEDLMGNYKLLNAIKYHISIFVRFNQNRT